MAFLLLLVAGPLAAAEIVGLVAARREGAALGQIEQQRNDARDLLQAAGVACGLAAHQVKPRDRGQQAHRVGMETPREQLADPGLLDPAAGIHDEYEAR